MNSSAPGQDTSEVEVTNISAHGVWLLVRGRELFMAYEDFPWFRDQPVKAILHVEEQSPKNRGGSTHDDFDNDPKAIHHVLKRILGHDPATPFTQDNLDY